MTPVLPTERGGWWHAYVCPVHGGELVHERLLEGTFPKEGARCPHGCRIDNPAVRGAWAALAHQACARRIRVLADERPSVAVELLAEYADLHASLTKAGQHEQAASWMLRGRLFQQALSEAIWAVSIGHAAWTLAGANGMEPVLPLLDALAAAAVAAREELVGQGKFSSNYTAWLTAAELVTSTAASLIRGEPVERDLTTLYDHVLAATGDDGWEWEGSTYYHGFVLRAYLLALRGTSPAELPQPVGDRLAAMIAALAGIATPGGVLPALHDGPYERPATEEEWAELRSLADQFVDRGALLDGWFGGPARPAAEVPSTFSRVGYAVVRAGGVHALVDAGPHGGSHGHRDKLSLYLYGDRTPWQPDQGQVPYASPLRQHYASTDAHPAFRVDGLEQNECTGTLTGDLARCDEAYEGVSATRRLIRGESYLVDVLRITADRQRRLTALLRPGVAFEAVVLPDGVVRTRWSGDEELTGWHASSEPASFSVGSGFGTSDDPQRFRSRVDWSADAEAMTFVSVYQAAGVTPKVTGIRLTGTELEVFGHEGVIHRGGVS